MNFIRTSKEEKRPLFVSPSSSTEYITYDGQKYDTITKEEYKKLNKLKSPVWLHFVKSIKDEPVKTTMKNEYDYFTSQSDMLKKATKGKINLYKTQKIIDATLYFFNMSLVKMGIKFDPITYEEYQWISKCSHGALIFTKPCNDITLYKLDYNSCYTSVYSSDTFLIPIKQGIFDKMTTENFEELWNTRDIIPYGMYRCKISDSKTISKSVFRVNPLNHYTHVDIRCARELGLTVELIHDNKPNALLYPRKTHCMTGHELLGRASKYLYKLKQKHPELTIIKTLLNSFWGASTQANETETSYKYDLPENCIVIKDNINEKRYTYINKDKPFMHNIARMKPFILAGGRKKISECVRLVGEDHIYGVLTDCIISDIDPRDIIKTSSELGDMKYDGKSEHSTIVNMRDKKINFIK